VRTVLDGVPVGVVQHDPFPHVVVEDAAPADLADSLLSEFPPVEIVTQGNPYGSNERYSYSARDVRTRGEVSSLWREFVETHVTKAFYTQLVRLFGSVVRATWPDVGARLTADEVSVGVRNESDGREVDVVLDCQVCLNTPVVGYPSSVRRAHLDNSHELFAGLLYLRPDDDRSVGGDLELYRLVGRAPRFHGSREVSSRYAEPAKTVPYRHNTLVCFPNTPLAVHGVTPRQTTDRPRYFVNFVADVKEELFDLGPSWERPWHRIARLVRQRSSF
jgi:hypothetical protein